MTAQNNTSNAANPLIKLAIAATAVCSLLKLFSLLRTEDISGQVAIVTGASRGLGLLIARELARNGCKVVICARSRDELDIAVGDISQISPYVLPVECDVSDQAQVQALVERATRHFGKVDILVNNAGQIQVGPLSAASVADFENAQRVMYFGMLYPILAVLPQMRERHAGKIVNITSIGGKVAVPHLLPYVGAKFAAVGLSEGLTAELAKDGISITTVVPGLMRTGSYLRADFQGRRQYEASWFGLSASLPGLAMNAESAARQIVNAAKRGETEVVLSIPAKLLSLFHALFPRVTIAILSIVNRYFLPQPTSSETGSRSGLDIQREMGDSPLSSFLELGRKDAEAYHQIPSEGSSNRNCG